MKGGRVVGATDDKGAKVVSTGWHGKRSIYTEDIVATIYSALGIDWTKTIDDTPSGRRYYYINNAGESGFRVDAGDEDDGAAGFPHAFGAGLRHVERAVQLDIDHPRPIRGRE